MIEVRAPSSRVSSLALQEGKSSDKYRVSCRLRKILPANRFNELSTRDDDDWPGGVPTTFSYVPMFFLPPGNK